MDRLMGVGSEDDIPEEHRATPIGDLLRYHNLEAPFARHERADVLVGMCMDNRNQLRIPENFAFILRTGGGNLRPSEFKVSYAIAVGGVRYIALIAHTQCGMVGLTTRRDRFIQGLVERAGWDADFAAQHFDSYAPLFEIGSELDFVLSEARRIRTRYAGITIVPMLYRLDDNRLYLLREKGEP